MEKSLKVFIILIIEIIICANCQRAKDKMYTPIVGASCFRRLNGTHQFGCSSKHFGSNGVIHVIKTIQDLEFLINSPPAPPYAPVIPPNLFTRENIMRLRNEASENISAIILINDIENMKMFSHESKCPNQYQNVGNQSCDINNLDSTWNPSGTGLLYENFPFPIYYVADSSEINKILDCFEKFNSMNMAEQASRSLCSIQINAFMSASINSEVCTRRTNTLQNLKPTRFCDPLEGKNIFATLFHRNRIVDKNVRAANKSEKFILLSCRLDTTSMFDGVSPGAMDSLISFATLVSIGHTLANLIPEQLSEYKRNILYAIFNGESYDYIGSQRFLYDLENGAFPMKSTKTNPISLEQIELMIDLGAIDQPNNINLYTASKIGNVLEYQQKIQSYSNKYGFTVNFNGPIESLNLPPTSAQTFLRHNLSFPAVIFNSKPLNKFYHSIYDDAANINYFYRNTTLNFTNLVNKNALFENFEENSIQMRIRNVSSALAMGLYDMITGRSYNGNEIANPVLIDEFLHCFLNTADCPLFRSASYPGQYVASPVPPNRYISVSGAFQSASIHTFEILGLLFSQKIFNITKDKCDHGSYYWYAGFDGNGECRITTQQYSEALSPAFLEENYNWKSGKYSTWTESTWQVFSARIYLRPSKIHETVTLSIGIVVLVLSFIFIFIVNSRSDILFENIPITTTITEPAAC